MDIILGYWRIKPEMEQEFLDFWKRTIESRPEGLVHEYLTRFDPGEMSTWSELQPRDCITYVNVGFWEKKELWKRLFDVKHRMLPFEAYPLKIAWLKVKDKHEW